MSRATAIVTAIACVVLVTVVAAQPPQGPGRGAGPPAGMLRMFPLFAALDTDEDGEISAKEIRKATGALKALDEDNNGKLTEDELRPRFPGGGPPDGPGGAGGPPPLDGERGPGGSGEPGGPGGGRDGARQRGTRPGGPPSAEAFVSRALEFDADGDGKLSKEELTKMAEQMARGPRPPS